MSSKTLLARLAGAALLAACGQAPSPSAGGAPSPSAAAESTAPGASGAASATSKEQERLAVARTLAMSDPGGSALIDNQIRTYQKKLQKLPQHADTLTL